MNKGILEQQYFSKLLEYFPIGKCEDSFYEIITYFIFEEDKEGHVKAVKIFKDKTWDQVDLSFWYPDNVNFIPLTNDGRLYYLPAFLHNYYNQKFACSNWCYSFIDYLIVKKKHQSDYFEKSLTIEQSKMVAIFLVNAATLFDDGYAQQALTNYWGNFLLS